MLITVASHTSHLAHLFSLAVATAAAAMALPPTLGQLSQRSHRLEEDREQHCMASAAEPGGLDRRLARVAHARPATSGIASVYHRGGDSSLEGF